MTSAAWEAFRLVKDSHGRVRPFVQCSACTKVMTFNKTKRSAEGRGATGASTSKLLGHLNTCKPPPAPTPAPEVNKPLTEDMKKGFLDKVIDWLVGQLQSYVNVDGPHYRDMIQTALAIGAECGQNVTAEELVPSSMTVTRRLAHRADQLRDEQLPELLEALEEGLVSVTTDGWTCKNRQRHYVALTAGYIVGEERRKKKVGGEGEDEDDGSRKILLFISHFDLENATAENLLEDLKTQFEIRKIDSALINKIHFVTDDGANLVKAVNLGGYSRSYCYDHLLNVVLQRSFTVHLNRADLFGVAGGVLVRKVRTSLCTLKTSKKIPKAEKARIPLGPEVLFGSKQYRSSLPMLRYAANNFDKVS